MAKDFTKMENSNASSNPSIHQVSNPKRRVLLQAGAALSGMGLLNALSGCATAGSLNDKTSENT
jgi:hypothetical protein